MALAKGHTVFALTQTSDGTLVYLEGTVDKAEDHKVTGKFKGAPTSQKSATLPFSKTPVIGYWSTGVVPSSRPLVASDELAAGSFALKGIAQAEAA